MGINYSIMIYSDEGKLVTESKYDSEELYKNDVNHLAEKEYCTPSTEYEFTTGNKMMIMIQRNTL